MDVLGSERRLRDDSCDAVCVIAGCKLSKTAK
jgi:hypothetical protein